MEYELKVATVRNLIGEDSLQKIQEMIDALYVTDVQNSSKGRTLWKIVADSCETSAMVFAGMSSILAFSSGFYDIPTLAFVAGSFSTASLAFLTFSGYAARESKERTARLNKTLEALGITTIRPTPTVDQTTQTEVGMMMNDTPRA
jgi:hypothetical protein